MKKKVVLFICKGNRFRSRIAEEIFNSRAPKGFAAESAGVTYQKWNDRATKKVLREISIERSNRKPRVLSRKMLGKASKIVVFNGVKLPGKKTELWPIDDCHAGDVACQRRARKRIENLVKNLIKSL